MFVFSIKTSKKKLLSYIFLAIIFALAVFLLIMRLNSHSTTAVFKDSKRDIVAQDNEQRIAYLKTFGWEVSKEAVEVREVVVPQNFNDVYLNYNIIQKEQGFDLTDYKGKLCNRYCYKIKNYPNCSDEVRANLLIINGVIIGGDVCSLKLDGFMHGLSLPLNEKS